VRSLFSCALEERRCGDKRGRTEREERETTSKKEERRRRRVVGAGGRWRALAGASYIPSDRQASGAADLWPLDRKE
jgi:hypothetical protein